MKKLPMIGLLLAGAWLGWSQHEWQGAPLATADGDPKPEAFVAPRSGEQVRGTGVVTRILADDNDGSRHQRFIVEVASGWTLLTAHNIDLAPRVSGLKVGDTVAFCGEYEWNDKGSVVHWTHHDPAGGHVGRWLKHRGRTYQ